MVAAVDVTPHGLHTRRPAQALGAPAPRGQLTEGATRKAPRLLLKQQDFVDFGYTDACGRCRHSLRYGYGKTKMPHSEACRARIENELKETIDGRRRIGLTQERMARHRSAREPAADDDVKPGREEAPGTEIAEQGSQEWIGVPNGEQAPQTPRRDLQDGR